MGIEVLKKLATKTPHESIGGIPTLSASDVSMSLVGIDMGPAALLRAMYAGDHGQANMAYLYGWAIKEAHRIANRPESRIMAIRAVDELVFPHMMLCHHCNGTGRVRPNQHNKDGDCRLCASTGKVTDSDEDMSELLSITTAEWSSLRHIYRAISAHIQEAHSDAAQKVRSRLS